MQRRGFIKLATWGAASVALSSGAARAGGGAVALRILDTRVELVDGERIVMPLFHLDGDPSFSAAAPVLRATEGEWLEIRVTNDASRSHGFEVRGAPGSRLEAIAPGETRVAKFEAPPGGAYFYLDPTNAPVNRVLGLHGAFIVAPAQGATVDGAPTPYSRAAHTPAIQALFGALGDGRTRAVPKRLLPGEPPQPRFPGDAWTPGEEKRDIIWMFNSIDPAFQAAWARGETIDPQRFVQTFTPRYFTLNGLSGFDAANDERTVPKGYVGQPTVIRTLNAGLATHAPHIHGNHIFELTRSAASGEVVLNANIVERDTWLSAPLDSKDVLLPFEQPTDVPAAVWPPSEEPFPMFYPMHCHAELSQTAGGGSYPQGLVTDWEILGPLGAAV